MRGSSITILTPAVPASASALVQAATRRPAGVEDQGAADPARGEGGFLPVMDVADGEHALSRDPAAPRA